MDYFQELVMAQLWQVTLVAICAWLVAETVLRHRPRLQHTVWAVVLLKCLIPPLAPSLVWPATWSSPTAWRGDRASVGGSVAAEAVVSLEIIDYTHTVDSLSNPQATVTQDRDSYVLLIGAWLVGTVILVALVLVQIARGYRLIRRCYRRPIPQLDAVMSKLRGISPARSVKLVVTRGRFGPAALNPLRPTIVMPGGLARRLSENEVGPILAHEMMHVRRGDLWLGWLQTTAVCIYWFHPLIWLASRRLSIATERCCDEDTVRWLQCEPHTYRRGLAATLLWKNSVPLLPVASAIRPAHLTRYRMEAVMKIDLLRPRSRWTSRMLLFALATLVLPGARWPAQATPPSDSKSSPAVEVNENEHAQTTQPAANKSTDDAKDTKNYPKTYRVSDFWPSMNRAVDLSPSEYRDLSPSEYSVAFRSEFESLMREIQQTVSPESWEARGGRGTMAPYMQNISIVISATSEVHDQVSDFLEAKRADLTHRAEAAMPSPLKETVDAIAASNAVVELKSLMLRGHRDDLVRACNRWKDLQDNIAIISRQDAAEVPGRGKSVFSPDENSHSLHVQWSHVEIAIAERLSRVVDEPNFGPSVRVLSRPRLRLPLKQTGMISIGDSFSVKRENERGEFDTTQYWGGTRLELHVGAVDPNMDLGIKWSSQELISNPSDASASTVIEKRSLESTFELASDHAVLLLATDGDGDERATLIAIWRVK